MSLTKATDHNQSLVLAAAISILCFGGIFACHLTETQKKAILDSAATAAKDITPETPTPWREILLAVGTFLGSGAVIDNRRKDVLIKRLKTEVTNANKIPRVMLTPANNHSTVIPPLCNN